MSDEFKVETVYLREHQGGQHVSNTSRTVRVTHIPTGITATCDSGRSQHRSRTIAMEMVQYGLSEIGWHTTRAPITTNEVNQPLLKGENDQ